jgi:hypothetical protein
MKNFHRPLAPSRLGGKFQTHSLPLSAWLMMKNRLFMCTAAARNVNLMTEKANSQKPISIRHRKRLQAELN